MSIICQKIFIISLYPICQIGCRAGTFWWRGAYGATLAFPLPNIRWPISSNSKKNQRVYPYQSSKIWRFFHVWRVSLMDFLWWFRWFFWPPDIEIMKENQPNWLAKLTSHCVRFAKSVVGQAQSDDMSARHLTNLTSDK